MINWLLTNSENGKVNYNLFDLINVSNHYYYGWLVKHAIRWLKMLKLLVDCCSIWLIEKWPFKLFHYLLND